MDFQRGRVIVRFGKEWALQWVFPSKKLSIDLRFGIVRRYHLQSRQKEQHVARSGLGRNVPSSQPASHLDAELLQQRFAYGQIFDAVGIRAVLSIGRRISSATTMNKPMA